MTLYELTTEYEALLAEYEAAEDDERRAEVLDMIDAVQDDIGDKGEAYARVLRNLSAQRDAYKAEADRLTSMVIELAGVVMQITEQQAAADAREARELVREMEAAT